MSNEAHAPVRVIELRQAENGWVITVLQKEYDYSRDSSYVSGAYKTYVAESLDMAAAIMKRLMKDENWAKTISLPAARRP